MPLSTNAPFNEFGQSMILRDIEQLYLQSTGAGTGSAGDGGTQDQDGNVTQDVDLSGYATLDDLDRKAQEILDAVALPEPTSAGQVLTYNGSSIVWSLVSSGWATNKVITTSSGTFTVPANITKVRAILVGGGGGYRNAAFTIGWVAASSGGATTSDLNWVRGGGSGGGIVIVDLTVNPGDIINVTVGAAGTNSTTSPTGGGNTTISMGSWSYSARGGLPPLTYVSGFANNISADVDGPHPAIMVPGDNGDSGYAVVGGGIIEWARPGRGLFVDNTIGECGLGGGYTTSLTAPTAGCVVWLY